MKRLELRTLIRALLATAPLHACCPAGSNQPGPSWTVSLNAGENATFLDGGVQTFTYGDGQVSVVPADYCTLCAPEKNCPACVASSKGYEVGCQTDGPDGGAVTINCKATLNPCIGGRRPAGLREEGSGGGAIETGSEVGDYFARLAWLEAASVEAFARLAGELRTIGAPASMIRAAGRAQKDEVRHTLIASRLARQYGSEPIAPVIEPAAARSLEQMAIENMVEGCVRETWAALLVSWQARAAHEPAVRASLRSVARDEQRHAELAFEVAELLDARLGTSERERVNDAKHEEVAALFRELDARPSAAMRHAAGMPEPEVARSLLTALRGQLWS